MPPTPQRTSQHRRQSSSGHDVQMSSSNSTATQFLGNRQKSWMQNPSIAPQVLPSAGPSRSYPTPPISTIDTSSGASFPPPLSSALPPSPAHSNEVQTPTEQLLREVAVSLPASAPPPALGVPATATAQQGHVVPSSGITCDSHTTVVTGTHFTAGTHQEGSESINGGFPRSQPQPQSVVHQQQATGASNVYPSFIASTDNQNTRGQTWNAAGAAHPSSSNLPHYGHHAMPPRVPQETTVSTPAANAARPQAPTVPSNRQAQMFRPLVTPLEAWKPALGPTGVIRVGLLQQACGSDDLQFLAIHQIYALSSVMPQSLQILAGFGAAQSHGLQMLGNLLVPNASLPAGFLSSCAKFPGPIEVLFHQNPAYFAALYHSMSTLELLSARWTTFESTIQARNFPPLIDEMYLEFWVQSPVLLRVMFTACCRRLRGKQMHKWIEQYEKIFSLNMGFYINRWIESGRAYVHGRPQTTQENHHILRLYSEVLQQQWKEGDAETRSPPAILASSILSHHNQAHGMQPRSQQYHPVQPTASRPGPPRPAATQAACSQPAPTQIVPSQPTNPEPQHNPPPFCPIPPIPGIPRRRGPVEPTVPSNVPQVQQQQQPTGPPNHPAGPPNAPAASTSVTLVFPPPGHVHPEQRVPNPVLTSLHEAHLMHSTRTLDNDGKEEAPSRRLYQFPCGFALAPQCLGDQMSTFQWKMGITPALGQALAKFSPSSGGQPPAYDIVSGSKMLQIRCVRVNSAKEEISEEKWFEMDSAWPEAIYIHVNGVEHFVRRKTHNGRDLPANITGSLREGHNHLKITFLRGPAEFTKVFYALAVEVIHAGEHDHLRTAVGHLPYSRALQLINERLNKPSANDDDEVCIVDDHFTIDLIDPFMARIFNIPVRSSACSHWECFDFDTFLSTRLLRTVRGNGMAEAWKCPICGRDARPTRLYIDSFLAHVRAELQQQNKLDTTRAILVKQDGTWEPKVEGKAQRDDKPNTPAPSKADNSSTPNPTIPNAGATSSSSATENAIEVIEID